MKHLSTENLAKDLTLLYARLIYLGREYRYGDVYLADLEERTTFAPVKADGQLLLCYRKIMPVSLWLPETGDQVTKVSQAYYGDYTLDTISEAGETHRPKLALVFINPIHRNISTQKGWTGLKPPWIGCANIWQLFADAELIDSDISEKIQLAKTDWSHAFVFDVYTHTARRGLYITNIVKWAGLDAKLSEKEKIKLYAPILIQQQFPDRKVVG